MVYVQYVVKCNSSNRNCALGEKTESCWPKLFLHHCNQMHVIDRHYGKLHFPTTLNP